jgi:hypothetical protein
MRLARSIGERRRSALIAVGASVLFALVVVDRGSAARPSCADAVLRDWTAGTLVGGAYPSDCYEAAIDALPEDLRAYTTAADDFRRAQISASRVLAEASTGGGPASSGPLLAGGAPTDDELRSVPSEVIFLGSLLATLAAAGGVAAVVRRRRGR